MKQGFRYLLFISLLIFSTYTTAQSTVVVGGKAFTEQFILAKMLVFILQSQQIPVGEKLNLSTHAVRGGFLDKEIDIYWEYTGTAYRAFMQQANPDEFQSESEIYRDAEKLYQIVKNWEKQTNDVIWLNKSTLNNTYAFAMQPELADKYNIKKISDLADYFNQKRGRPLRFGLNREFYVRPDDGFKKLQSVYGFDVPRSFIKMMGNFAVYGNLARGQIQVGLAYNTDPQVKQFNFTVLEDDLKFFPIYNPAPIVHAPFVEKYPEAVTLINKIGPLIDTQTMIDLNYQVDIEKKSIEDVAKTWLIDQQILPSED